MSHGKTPGGPGAAAFAPNDLAKARAELGDENLRRLGLILSFCAIIGTR